MSLKPDDLVPATYAASAKHILIIYIWPALAFTLVLVSLPFVLPISFIIWIYSEIIKYYILYTTQGQAVPVGYNDAVWFLDNGTDHVPLNTISTGFMFVSGKLDVAKWQKALFDRFVDAQDEDGVRIIPNLSCNATPMYGTYVWIKIPEYNIKDNCFLWDKSVPKSKTELMSLLEEISTRPLPVKNALWQLILIPYGNKMEACALMRVHHAIGDGMSFVKAILTKLVDAPVKHVRIPVFGNKGRFRQTVKGIFTGPAMLMRLIWPAEEHILRSAKLSGDIAIARSEQIDLNMIKRMKNAAGCTVNDILMACLSSAFREYFRRQTSSIPQRFLAYVVVDIRGHSGKVVMDNQISAVIFPLPLQPEEPMDCIKEVKKQIDIIKNSAEPVVNALFQTYLMSCLPTVIARAIVDNVIDKFSLVLSNVPGPTNKIFICSNPIEDMIFWPPLKANIGMYIIFHLSFFNPDLQCLAI